MRPISLLLLRLSTGLYLMFWGLIKLTARPVAMSVSDKYYAGLLSANFVNYSVGILEVAVGLMVMIGLFRLVAYTAQAVFYLFGLLAITPYILDPFALYLVSDAKLTFFPSTTLLFASLIMIAFKEYDTLSVDYEFR